MKTLALTAALVAFALPAAADAQQIKYQISGGGHVATFQLDAKPVPMIVDDGFDFGVTTDVSSFDGVANLAGITFYLNPFEGEANVAAGGLTYLDNGSFFQFDLAGPQLFSGKLGAPRLSTFAPLQLADLNTGATITISAAYVPEPGSWAMMAAGFGLAGGTLRRKARRAIA